MMMKFMKVTTGKGDTLDVSPPAPNGNREGDADVDVKLLQ